MQCRRRRVRRLATDLQASYDRIDSLVNNAGAIFATGSPHRRTAHG